MLDLALAAFILGVGFAFGVIATMTTFLIALGAISEKGKKNAQKR